MSDWTNTEPPPPEPPERPPEVIRIEVPRRAFLIVVVVFAMALMAQGFMDSLFLGERTARKQQVDDKFGSIGSRLNKQDDALCAILALAKAKTPHEQHLLDNLLQALDCRHVHRGPAARPQAGPSVGQVSSTSRTQSVPAPRPAASRASGPARQTVSSVVITRTAPAKSVSPSAPSATRTSPRPPPSPTPTVGPPHLACVPSGAPLQRITRIVLPPC